MLQAILNSKVTTMILVLSIIVGLTASYLYWESQQADASVPSQIMYLLPLNKADLEVTLTPTALADNELQIGYSADWKVISGLAQKGELRALIIHRNALPSANVSQLRTWFRGGLVVAGIGIPAQTLADTLGFPGLNIWGDRQIYKTNSYFYMFSINAKGTPEERQKALDALLSHGIDSSAPDITKPTSVIVSQSTDSLLSKEGKAGFRDALKWQIEAVQR